MSAPPGPNRSPTADGEVLEYQPTERLAAGPPVHLNPSVLPGERPDRLYYVNGILTQPASHRAVAELVASIAERSVWGVFNASGGRIPLTGFLPDIIQCFRDYDSILGRAITERVGALISKPVNNALDFAHGVRRLFDPNAPAPPQVNLLVDIHRLLPNPEKRAQLLEARLRERNPATAALFHQLRLPPHRGLWHSIVAHSQGNLITCDALWALVFSYGEAALDRVRVYSLASPAPAWPLGLRFRRKVYSHTNDFVTMLDPHSLGLRGLPRPAGDHRQNGWLPVPHFGPHDVRKNIHLLNFANRLRSDHGLPAIAVPADLRR